MNSNQEDHESGQPSGFSGADVSRIIIHVREFGEKLGSDTLVVVGAITLGIVATIVKLPGVLVLGLVAVVIGGWIALKAVNAHIDLVESRQKLDRVKYEKGVKLLEKHEKK
jgi:hypothetical protein